MRNLVTGGAGFLGSHLINNLLINGEEVICLDNYLTGQKKNVEKYKQIRCFQIPFPQYGSDDDDILNGLGPLTPVPMSSSLDFSFLNKEPEWINLALVVT